MVRDHALLAEYDQRSRYRWSSDRDQRDRAGSDKSIEVMGGADEHTIALAVYLDAVSAQLAKRGLGTGDVCVFAPTPHRGLSASMLVHLPAPDVAHRAAGTELPAGWHEELGWWISPSASGSGARARPDPYWLGVLLPSAAAAADALAAAARCLIRPCPGTRAGVSRDSGVDTHVDNGVDIRAATRPPDPSHATGGEPRVLRYRANDHLLLAELHRATA